MEAIADWGKVLGMVLVKETVSDDHCVSANACFMVLLILNSKRRASHSLGWCLTFWTKKGKR